MIECINKGFTLFIVTNQGGTARGFYSKNDVEILHEKITNILKNKGIIIKDIAICPHHNLIENCLCRKPNPLMLEKLIARYSIDKTSSYMIGYSNSDIESAKLAGVKSILVPKNSDIRSFITQII